MSEIKERPILFSGPMVRAILEGRKTVTRRIVKGIALEWLRPDGFTPEFTADPRNELCPYGKPGGRLWLRESTEAFVSPCGAVTLARYCADKAPVLVTDCADPAFNGSVAHWNYPRDVRPSIHMKREHARILLEITDVRIERLQDITEEQAVAEGVDRPEKIRDVDVWDGAERELFNAMNQPRDRFKRLWADINGAESWDANPWVWVVEFKRVTP